MGYVGCVTAACMSRDGHRVIGVDVDQAKIDAITSGESPVEEPGLDDLVKEAVAAGHLTATSDVEQAVRETELALVAVGTPSSDDGAVSSLAVERVIESIGHALNKDNKPYTAVVRSTLLPGILEERLAPLLEQAAGRELGQELVLCNNPEFLRETTAIRDYDQAPFVLVGAADPSRAQAVFDLYAKVAAEQIVTDTRTAALVKYSCNAFHAMKVAFANEIGALAKAFGADGQEVMQLLCRDGKLNISPAYLRPGFAFGGSCLPKDVRALARYAQQQAIDVELLSSLLPSNDAHLRRAHRMIESTGLKAIGLAGLSFKAGTDDLRESPQVVLAETLLGRGYDLRIYDPGVMVSRLRGTNLAYVDEHLPHLAALLVPKPSMLYEHADLLVLGTDVATGLDWRSEFTGEVLDLRRDLVAARQTMAVSP